MVTAIRVLVSQLLGSFRRKHFDTGMNEEFQSHFEMLADRFVNQGMTKGEALLAARRQFGGVTQIKEQLRERNGLAFLASLWADTRYAFRQMRKSPVFAATAVLTLALGIGANTAMFSLIDAVMLRFLPVERPQELVLVQRDLDASNFTNPLWEAVRDQQDVFSGAFAWSERRVYLAQGDAAQYGSAVFVSGNYFATLGVRPAAGRLISSADDQRGCAATAVLSYGFWQSHFGGATNAVGSTVSVNHQIFQVIGVSAPRFYGVDVGSQFDVAVPICSMAVFDQKDQKESRLNMRAFWWLSIMGRLKPGISAQRAKARLRLLSPSIMNASLPQGWAPKDQQSFLKAVLVISPAGNGVSDLRHEFGQPLTILMAIVGLVLLIACANIASLMLARSTARAKEIAIRKAIGASRSRLMRQLLTESLLLSLLGALLALMLARWGSALLVRNLSTSHNQVVLDLAPDGLILAFTAAIAVLTGILVGLLPALRSTRTSLMAAMKGSEAADVEHHPRVFRAGKWIVGAQVALSMVLVIGGGLLLRSFTNLLRLDIGFERKDVFLVRTHLDVANVPATAQPATYDEIGRRLSAIPGITSVARSWMSPLSGRDWDNLIHADWPNAPTGDEAVAFFNSITPGYFATMQTPLLAGRDFNDQDTKTSQLVAIVNQTVARKFFPGTDALGKHFRKEAPPGQVAPLIEIVGIVKDAKYGSLREDTTPTIFFPATQVPEAMSGGSYELRTSVPPSAIATAVQQAVRGVNHEIPLEFNTMAEQVDDNMVQERLLAELSGFFGGLALLLAMIGLYGVLSYLVTQRQTEFGIRMALGARPTSILRLVMSDTLGVLIGGIAVGIGLSLASVRLLQKMLFGLSPHDAITMLLAAGVLAAVGVVAGFLPARRATRVDPMVALRYE